MANNKVKGLTDLEIRFIDVWFNCGFKNGLAYRTVSPDVTVASSDSLASKILASEAGKAYVEQKREEIRKKEEINLSFIVTQLKSIIFEVQQQMEERDEKGKLIARKDFKSQLTALAQLSKLAGLDAPKKIDVTSGGEPIKISFLD